MNTSSTVYKMGARASKLAQIQSRIALDHIQARLPACRFELAQLASPGDRDRQMDLRESPPDFFTRDLDDAVRAGTLDAALHSAKDLPDPVPDDLDWFWLPWSEDRRDCLILPPGRSMVDVPSNPRIGVSSARREIYARTRFPKGEMLPIRGNIEDRLQQLDDGHFDLILMAGAALLRLGLTDRITEWIPIQELAPPAGQGVLAITFRKGDPRWQRLRSLFVKSVTFAGAGSGDASLCTLAASAALEHCDVCLYDALMDVRLLTCLPPHAMRVDTGKRAGNHRVQQQRLSEMIATYARRGWRVVRLKGGDPGLFGRLAEEAETLDALHLPYRIIPGISSLLAATTGTGIWLTRRDISRGFCAMTPRGSGGCRIPVDRQTRGTLPIAFFMATKVCRSIMSELKADGIAPHTRALAVLNAGADDEAIIDATVDTLAHSLEKNKSSAPGLILVGDGLGRRIRDDAGALRGQRVLLTCSAALQARARRCALDLGAVPLPRPLIRLCREPAAETALRRVSDYNWVIVTSPTAVRMMLESMRSTGLDIRRLPLLAVCGPGTARELNKVGLSPDCEPADTFGAEGLLHLFQRVASPSARVLRLRSASAPDTLTAGLRTAGFRVDDLTLYRNVPVEYSALPAFDSVIFTSGSAVESFFAQWSTRELHGKTVVAIGSPTARKLRQHMRAPDIIAAQETVESCFETLAAHAVNLALEDIV